MTVQPILDRGREALQGVCTTFHKCSNNNLTKGLDGHCWSLIIKVQKALKFVV